MVSKQLENTCSSHIQCTTTSTNSPPFSYGRGGGEGGGGGGLRRKENSSNMETGYTNVKLYKGMHARTNVSGIRRFMRVNQLSKFIPHMAELTNKTSEGTAHQRSLMCRGGGGGGGGNYM